MSTPNQTAPIERKYVKEVETWSRETGVQDFRNVLYVARSPEYFIIVQKGTTTYLRNDMVARLTEYG